MDDRAAEISDALECRGQVGDGEATAGRRVSPGPGPRAWTPRRRPVGVGLPHPGPGCGGPGREGDAEDAVPEAAGAIGIVGRKLDQWRGHRRSIACARAWRATRCEPRPRSRASTAPCPSFDARPRPSQATAATRLRCRPRRLRHGSSSVAQGAGRYPLGQQPFGRRRKESLWFMAGAPSAPSDPPLLIRQPAESRLELRVSDGVADVGSHVTGHGQHRSDRSFRLSGCTC